MSCYLLGRKTGKKGVEGRGAWQLPPDGMMWVLGQKWPQSPCSWVSSYQNFSRWSHLQQQIGVSVRSRMSRLFEPEKRQFLAQNGSAIV